MLLLLLLLLLVLLLVLLVVILLLVLGLVRDLRGARVVHELGAELLAEAGEDAVVQVQQLRRQVAHQEARRVHLLAERRPAAPAPAVALVASRRG